MVILKNKRKEASDDICSFDRDYILEKALTFLQKKKYTWVAELGSGTYGDVIAMKKKSDPKIIAVKLQHKIFTSPGETYLWPCLKHPNILPVLGRFHYENIDLFIMPLLSESLSKVLKKPHYREHPILFELTIDWLRDIITGLEYLHTYGVCHLDLKADNVLISSDLKAVIADFGGISETKETVNRYLVPIYYSPPETWTSGDVRPSVDGEKLDVWSAGFLILNCFTDRWADQHFFEKENWKTDVFPLIFECLQEEFFRSLLNQANPSCNITKEDCSLALNLVQGIMRYNPPARPSCSEILTHPLISKKSCKDNLLPPDEMWFTGILVEPETSDKHQEIMQFPEDQLEIGEINKIIAGFDIETESTDAETKNIEPYSSQTKPDKKSEQFQYEEFSQQKPILITTEDAENPDSRKCAISEDRLNIDPDGSNEIIPKKMSKTKKIQKRLEDMFSRVKQFFTIKKK